MNLQLQAGFLVIILLAGMVSAFAQPTAFIYQGRLTDNGTPANGEYDLRFYLRDASVLGNPVGTTNQASPVGVSNGLFTVTLDWGSASFDGSDRWLEIGVRTNGSVGPYTTLFPRQSITSAPYSIRAGTASAYEGAITDEQLSANVARLTVPNTAQPATGTPVVFNGFIIDAQLTSGGSGYASPPAVTVNDGTGSGATITATVAGGAVTALHVVDTGSGYSAAATLSIASPPSNNYQEFVNQTIMLNESNFFQGSFYGFGNGLKNLNASELTNGTVPLARLPSSVSLLGQSIASNEITDGTITPADLNVGNFNTTFWSAGGNAGTAAGTHFIGTTDNQPLEFKVNGRRALRLEDNGDSSYDPDSLPDGAPNVIGGSARNFVAAGVVGGTIGGGGATNFYGIACTNAIYGDHGTIAGGRANRIGSSIDATISGGFSNLISSDAYGSFIGGGWQNQIGMGTWWGVISGGRENRMVDLCNYGTISGGVNNLIDRGTTATIGGGSDNEVHYSGFCTIGGGDGNRVSSSAGATIAGGSLNDIRTNSSYAVISGGNSNEIGTNADYSTIGGGSYNQVSTNAEYATISGGSANLIGTNADYSVIGGGSANYVTDNAAYATIPGGYLNVATNFAFAAGRRAKASHTGAFVWGDSTDANIASTNANSVTMRASGGYRLFSNSGASIGVFLAVGSGTWASMSDRNSKENFAPANPTEILDRLAALPLQTWNYKSQDAGIRHIGPMAQDFKAAFGVGENGTTITTVDADGVALAAIQGLNQKLTEELRRRDAENADLRLRLERLEKLFQANQPTQDNDKQ